MLYLSNGPNHSKGNEMKTHLFAIAVAVAIIASVWNASCVKHTLNAMGRVNIVLSR
jgi:hypothetical protein